MDSDSQATWSEQYPLETGEYWIFEGEISFIERKGSSVTSYDTVTRRDSVVVFGEDELPTSQLGIHVIDYWTSDEESGEIHHYYSQQQDGLYCMAVYYQNPMNLDDESGHLKHSHFIELSPLPGNAIFERDIFYPNDHIMEIPVRKVLPEEYDSDEPLAFGDEYGPYLRSCITQDETAYFRIWDCTIVRKEYKEPLFNQNLVVVEDYMSSEGAVRRSISTEYMQVLDINGNSTNVLEKYNATFEMVDGTYQH